MNRSASIAVKWLYFLIILFDFQSNIMTVKGIWWNNYLIFTRYKRQTDVIIFDLIIGKSMKN